MASDFFSPKLCNPFAADIFPDGEAVAGDSVSLHHAAEERLEEAIAQATHESAATVREGHGRVILLRAPRAGYGKSHLLHRLRNAGGAQAFVVPVAMDSGEKITWKPLMDQVLAALHAPADGNGATALDHVARRTFALVNAALLRSGQVPCDQPEAAATAVEQQYFTLFDMGQAGQPVAAWFQEHFERLLPATAPALAAATGLPEASAILWLRALCVYAQAGGDGDSARLGAMEWALQQPSLHPSASPSGSGMQFLQAPPSGDGFYKEKLGELCRLTATTRPLVILLDHLDGFHGSGEKVLRLANVLNEWRQLSGRVRFILSVNQDLWTQTFLTALPSALEDRLTSGQITLGGISREAAESLIRQRLATWKVPDPAAQQFLGHLALGQFFAQEAGRLVSPRAVLRYAAQAWQEPWTNAPAAQPVPGPESSVPIAKMREMLERLKENRGMSASHATVTKAPDPPALPVGHPNGTPAMDHPSGAILPDPVPATPRAASVESPFLTQKRVGPDHALQVRFHTLRAHFASSPWLLLDQDRLYHLLKLSGQRLALVRFLETGLPGLPGAIAGVWQSPDAEILFGSEPYEDRTYWAALIDFARQRSAQVPGSRLVLFSSASSPVNLGVWMDQDEIVAARGHFLDLQTLDHPALAALYATDEVLRECERGALPLGSADAFAAMAPQLESLWKKLTRPPSVAAG
jgi:hypothetical protein